MLTQRMQVQAIADKLAGLPVKIRLNRMSEPWLTCWKALEEAEPGKEQTALLQALKDNPLSSQVMNQIIETTPGQAFGNFPSLAELAKDLKPIRWLWKGWIPLGMITLVGAAPGTGKTNFCLDIAKRVIHGDNFPDGQSCSRARTPVIYVDAESVPNIINERAEAWEMDRSRLYMMLPDADEIIDFNQDRYQGKLLEMIEQLMPSLIIIDSLSSISTTGENNVEDIRKLLSFLNMVATDYDVALMLNHHLRKGSGTQIRQSSFYDGVTIDDLRGSSHIVAIARSVIGISMVQTEATPNRNGPRKVELIKTNLGAYPDPLGFEMAPLYPKGMLLRWLNETPQAYKEPTTQDNCIDWLEDVLRNATEPLKPKEIVEMAKDEGYSRAMVYTARRQLGVHVENQKGRKDPENTWSWKE